VRHLDETALQWALTELWPILSPPVTLLESLGYGAAVVFATAALANLPLHMARPAKGGDLRCASERVALSFAPSARLMARARNTAANFKTQAGGFLAVVDPSPTSGSPLPFAAAEVEIISSRFFIPWGAAVIGPTVLSGKYANREVISSMGQYFAIRHFACHATYNSSEPLLSGMAVANDQLLSAADFMRKNKEFRLTVLSCCESAKSGEVMDDSIGLLGLIMACGSSGVIGTLWPVYDFQATLLMLRFYDFWIDEKIGPIRSLAWAQSWLTSSSRQQKVAYLEEGELRMKERGYLNVPGKRFAELIDALLQTDEKLDYFLNLQTSAAYVFAGL
jgi:CHAT domain-containing protein